MQKFLAFSFLFISWGIGMCSGGAVVSISIISFESKETKKNCEYVQKLNFLLSLFLVWASKVCNETVAETWVTHQNFNCYCRKYTLGIFIRFSKYRLEGCERIPTPGNVSMKSTHKK